MNFQTMSQAEELRVAAVIIAKRLPVSDLRTVLRELDRSGGSAKSVEQIVVDTEDPGRRRSRIEDESLSAFLVDVGGADLLNNRTLRRLLAFRASESELDRLYEFPNGSRCRGTSQDALAKCVAERTWRPGKPWARYFVSVLGLPPLLAGVAGIPSGPAYEDVQPHVPLPPLSDFQQDLRLQVGDLLHAGPKNNRGILSLPTGAGKTRTTVEALIDWWLMSRLGSVLWIAQTEELCEQAIQAFREVWIDRGDSGVRQSLRLFRLWGSRTVQLDTDGVIVSTIDKLRSVLGSLDRGVKPQAVLGEVGTIVIDEAHRADAQSYRHVLGALGVDFSPGSSSAIPVLGLTATPLRSQHDETLRLCKRFDGRLLRPSNLPKEPGEMLTVLRQRQILSTPVHMTLPTGRTTRLTPAQDNFVRDWNEIPSDLLSELGQERNRNNAILAAILELDGAWPVLFFGCSVQHAEAMTILLRRKGASAATVTSDTREAVRRETISAFKKGEIRVLSNYGVLTTGFDAPQVRAVVVGRPTTSRVLYDQMIGRGMRGEAFGGTPECLVIDVEDNLIHRNGDRVTTAAQQYGDYWR